MAKSSFKRSWGVVHLWLGLISGIVVLVVSLTGCIFVFEEEIRNYTQKEYRFVDPEPRPKISTHQLIEIVERNFPEKQIDQIRIFSPADRAIIVKLTDPTTPTAALSKKKQKEDDDKPKTVVSLNPYTGQILGPWNMESDFLHGVEKMHKTLLLGETGKVIIKINIVVFLIMLLSGLVLWFPSKKNQVKSALRIKWDAKWQRVNYDLHNVVGFYFILPLLVITLTGIWWAVKPSQKLVYAWLGSGKMDEKKAVSTFIPNQQFKPWEVFPAVSTNYPGWNEAHINFPRSVHDPIRINLRYPSQVVRKQNVFEFDRYSGLLLTASHYKNYSAADKVKHANRNLHTGQAFGYLGKVLMFFASLFSATLPVTGFLIWYQKKRNKPAPRKTRNNAPVTTDSVKKKPYQPRRVPQTV